MPTTEGDELAQLNLQLASHGHEPAIVPVNLRRLTAHGPADQPSRQPQRGRGPVMRWIAGGACGLALGSCSDCFFRLQGHLVDCTTNAPISGAAISVHIDQGMNGPRMLPGTFTSDAIGLFKITTDGTENCGATATLTFQKDGYTAAEMQYKGAPKSDVQQCLTPIAPP